MYMVDTIDAAAACPLVKTDNIFGVVVTYGLQIAELTLTGRFVRHEIRGLYVHYLVILPGYEVDLSSAGHLSCENLIPLL